MRKWIFRSFALALVGFTAFAFTTNMYVALNRSWQKRTMADLRTIGTALEAMGEETGAYDLGPRRSPPEVFHSVSRAELERALVPKYARKLPDLDGWKHPIRVYVGRYDDRGHARSYLVRSLGRDGRAEGRRYSLGRTSGFDEDLVFSDGNFVRYPEGI